MSKCALGCVIALWACAAACGAGDRGAEGGATDRVAITHGERVDSTPDSSEPPTGNGSATERPTDAPSATATPLASDSNLLANPSFEDGRPPWFSLFESSPHWADFAITDARARTGTSSAVFDLNSRGEIPVGTRVWGVVSDLRPDALPRRIAGHYRVEDWQRGTARQYVQTVISIQVARGRDPLQLAWILCGIDEPPFAIANRKFVFVGPREPVEGEWVAFDIDVHETLRREWGVNHPASLAFESVRIFFEARFDGYTEFDGPVGGKVYYDDVYFGD